MLTGRLLNIALIVLSVVGSGNSTEVCFDFKSDDAYFLKYGDNSKVFNSTAEFFSGLNIITSPYFNTTSIKKSNDTITFNGISNTEPCDLVLQSSGTFKPVLILNCMNNTVKFDKLYVNNYIKSLDVKTSSDYQVEIQKLEVISSSNVKIDGKIIVKNYSSKAGSKVTFDGGSKVVIG